jgi:outer membrane receptor protein involved in Fe transport
MKCATACISFLLMLLTGPLSAQTRSGSFSGIVRDSLQVPIPYATITLYKKGQLANAFKTTYTDTKGAFEMKTDTGNYVITISHLGFEDISVNFNLTSEKQVVNDLVLFRSARTLQNVTVTTRKPLIEQKDDRIIYNAENDPAAKAESASDILRKAPFVTVDGEGNIQLNGQSNFKVLLNGRETSMFAANVKEALKGFPGAVISKIEVITSPSAKYDAEGVGGIINIITKKKVTGYNGYLNSFFSTLNNYSENLSLSIKKGKFGISGYIGASGITKYINGQNSLLTIPLTNAVFSQRMLNGERANRYSGVYSNLEIVYEIDSFKTVAVYGSLNRSRNNTKFEQFILTTHTSQPAETGLLLQQNQSSNPGSGIGADFIRRFKNMPEKELSFRLNGQFNTNSGSNTSSLYQSQERFVSNESLSKNREYTFQTDLVQPLNAKQKLETGIKTILRDASSDFQSLVKYKSSDNYRADPANSDHFQYRQQVLSGYISYGLQLKKGSIRTGLRVEHTRVDGNFATSQTRVSQRYTNLVPNLLVSRKFNDVYTLTASYNMRLQRPYISNLNPFVNNNDSLNINYGNPGLGPQVLHSLQIQNRLIKGKFFGSFNLNSSYTDNMIVQYAFFDPATGITSITSANVGKEFQAGVNLYASTAVGEKLNVGVNAGLRYNHIENRSNFLQRKEGLSGSAFGNFTYRIIGKFTISGSGGVIRNPYALVNSPSTQYFYQVNFGYRFMNDKLAVTMNVNNFHDKYFTFTTVTEDPYFRSLSTSISPYRVIYFGATYNFGKLKENVSKKKGVTNDDLVQ